MSVCIVIYTIHTVVVVATTSCMWQKWNHIFGNKWDISNEFIAVNFDNVHYG